MRDETKKQLFKKNLRYYYDASNDIYTIPVPVMKWKDKQLLFSCPFCHTHYKINGNPYKRCFFKDHIHGDAGMDKDGNYGTRSAHCSDTTKVYWGLNEINYEFLLVGGNLIY